MSATVRFRVFALIAVITYCVGLRAEQGKRPGSIKGNSVKPTSAKKNRTLPFTIGRETTYVTGPVDKDGYVDYVTALNERLRRGIKPADNANVLLWQVFGPLSDGTTMPPGYFHWLGIHQPPEHGDYWIPQKAFLEKHQGLAPWLFPKGSVLNVKRAEGEMWQAGGGPWGPRDYPWIAAWLEANAKPLALAVQATRRPYYFEPLVPAGIGKDALGLGDANLPNAQRCREVGDALVARAMWRLGNKQVQDAWQDLLACHRLARLVGQAGTFVEMLACLAIDGDANRGDLAFVGYCQDARHALACLHDLQQLAPLPTVADKADLSERFVLLDAMMGTMHWGWDWLIRFGLDGKPREDKSLGDRAGELALQGMMMIADWDVALRRANGWYDRAVAALRTPNRDERERQLTAFARDSRALRTDMRRRLAHPAGMFLRGPRTYYGETMGDLLIVMLLPAMEIIEHTAERVGQGQTNVRLAFALAAYRADHGWFPGTLQELSPTYLAEVPLDPFNGQPLVYRPSTDAYLLYSVGLNGQDEGGRGYEDHPPGDDLSVRMQPWHPIAHFDPTGPLARDGWKHLPVYVAVGIVVVCGLLLLRIVYRRRRKASRVRSTKD